MWIVCSEADPLNERLADGVIVAVGLKHKLPIGPVVEVGLPAYSPDCQQWTVFVEGETVQLS